MGDRMKRFKRTLQDVTKLCQDNFPTISKNETIFKQKLSEVNRKLEQLDDSNKDLKGEV